MLIEALNEATKCVVNATAIDNNIVKHARDLVLNIRIKVCSAFTIFS